MYLFLTPTTNKPLACLTVFKTYGAKNKYIKNFAKQLCLENNIAKIFSTKI